MFSFEQMLNKLINEPLNILVIYTCVLHVVAMVYFIYKMFAVNEKRPFPYYMREPGYTSVVISLGKKTWLVALQILCLLLLEAYSETAKYGLFYMCFLTTSFVFIVIAALRILYMIVFFWKILYEFGWANFMANWFIEQKGVDFVESFAALEINKKIDKLRELGYVTGDQLGNFAYLLNLRMM